jgi:hypothetical protein
MYSPFHMFDPQLFLGFQLDAAFSDSLKAVEPGRRGLFIQESPSYLQEASYQGSPWLGKFAGEISSLEDLFLLEKNVFTLLMKLVPDYPFENVHLALVPIFRAPEISMD